ncbi:ester cyclase [Agromyces intestinalis]|uniref:ester cyclase n=1 Tax=Agromyces intestinalis TaxID=2592652 RepID=UPI001AEFC418|nr:ester cyclase [Agromyces intestinalis]
MLDIAERSIQGVIGNDSDELHAVVHPRAVNREARTEPPAARGRGPRAFAATGSWLAAAFDELTWATEEHVIEGDLVVTSGRLSGRHTGDFVVWTPDGTVERAFAPTGRIFSVRQAHFQRVLDGLVVEHWAVRDDQGMAMQLGWIPPTIGYLVRCQRATMRARREAARSGKASS